MPLTKEETGKFERADRYFQPRTRPEPVHGGSTCGRPVPSVHVADGSALKAPTADSSGLKQAIRSREALRARDLVIVGADDAPHCLLLPLALNLLRRVEGPIERQQANYQISFP
jgi:hypothetical protein